MSLKLRVSLVYPTSAASDRRSDESCLSIASRKSDASSYPVNISGLASVPVATSDAAPLREYKRFLHITDRENSLQAVCGEVVEKLAKLYPNDCLEIEKLQDEFYCDLDPDYLVGDVFSDGSAVVAVLAESPESNGSNPSVTYRTYSSSSKRKASDILPELQRFHKSSQRRARRSSIWLTDNNGGEAHNSHDHRHPNDHNGSTVSHSSRLLPSTGNETALKSIHKNTNSLSPELAASNHNGATNGFEIAESDEEVLGDVRNNAEFELPPPERTYASIDPHKPPSPQSADKQRGNLDGHAFTNGLPIAESTPCSVSLNSVPLPELSPRPAVSPISSPARKTSAQVALPGRTTFDQIKLTPKLIIQSRTPTTDSALTVPVLNDKQTASKTVSEKAKVPSTPGTSTAPNSSDKKTKSTILDKKKAAVESKSKKTTMKTDTTPTKTSKAISKSKTAIIQNANTSAKELSTKPTKNTAKVPTAPAIMSPVTHSNPKTATAINIMSVPVSTQSSATPNTSTANISSASSTISTKTTVQSSLGTEKKIPVKVSSSSKVTKTATKPKAKPATPTPKQTKTAGTKKFKSSELVTASDEEDEVDLQPTKTSTGTSSSVVASVGNKSKTAGAKTSRSLVPASKFDLFNLDSSIISDSDSDVYDSVTNSIKPISKPSKNSVSAPSKPSTRPPLAESSKQTKSLNMTKTANLTGPAKDPKSAETLKVSKKIELTKTVNKAKIVKEMTESELVNQTQAETKKTVSSKETKEVAKSKVVNSDSAKEFTKIVQTKEPESSEPVQTAKKAAAPELKKDTLPKEIAKPTIEAKKFEPVKITESVKKPEPVIEARTPDTKPAEPLAKNKLASVTPPISRQNSKLDLDSSDSESESEDDDGSDIPSSPEPTKRLIAVNTPSLTKTNHSQTSSQTSSFMELLEKKSVADSVAPVTNSIAGTGNILAELQEKPVEKDKPQPPKRIAGMQSLSALAKRAIPEVHDSTSSKIQSQKAKAVVKQPVVEVSSDESSSDDDSDDGSDDSDSDEDSDDDEPKVKIGGRKDSEKKKSKNRGFMGMIKSAKRV